MLRPQKLFSTFDSQRLVNRAKSRLFDCDLFAVAGPFIFFFLCSPSSPGGLSSSGLYDLLVVPTTLFRHS